MTESSIPKKCGGTEELILRTISAPAKQVTPEEAKHDADTRTAEDYDDSILQALRERESESIRAGYGGVQHPTSRIFEIGVDSIRAGRPSELFLTLLEEIGKMAEDRDVLSKLFPETFPRRIKTTTVRAARREAAIVERFKEHIRKYLEGSKIAKVTGSEEKGGSWSWVDRTYAEAVETYKRGLPAHERKALDRALMNQGGSIIEWRDHIAHSRKCL